MNRNEIRKGLRVVLLGPADPLTPLFDPESHKLKGKVGTIVYGISEDIFCYPEDNSSDLVWVAFDGDRMPRRQVSASWLAMADGG